MKHLALATAGLALAAGMSACTVVAPRPAYYQPYRYNEVVVQVAPPPPYVEVIGVAPYAGNVWLGGAWFWEGGRHTWRPGHWEAPRPGHVWVPHRWEQVGPSWHFREGHWRR
ncbi:MAG: YXWGXW repeat-containing protein [Burkholderiales bacterium]|nr:YXWGXW repeat-containing protein [Burkholderiales bacterium]